MANTIRRVCVFAGSRPGLRASYAAAAASLGRALVLRGWGLVYGGASVGLMGTVAEAVLAAGGEAIGVIPQALAEREIAHSRLSHLHVVQSMHERKAKMSELADAFVALPGGFGTLDELFEALTWAQLAMHAKPIGLLDTDGYFGPLVAVVDRAIAEGFVTAEQRALLLVGAEPDALLDALACYEAPALGPKWAPPPEP